MTFPLCIWALFLENGDLRSSLLSLSALLSYIVLMTRFDKFWQIGGYFKVVGRIAYKSMGPFFVIFILLCGFVVAFRNRSVYKGTDPSTSSFNTTDHFNKSFEYSFFQIYFMMVGDNNNENMGIYDLTGPNLVTFLIYFVFIFLTISFIILSFCSSPQESALRKKKKEINSSGIVFLLFRALVRDGDFPSFCFHYSYIFFSFCAPPWKPV